MKRHTHMVLHELPLLHPHPSVEKKKNTLLSNKIIPHKLLCSGTHLSFSGKGYNPFVKQPISRYVSVLTILILYLTVFTFGPLAALTRGCWDQPSEQGSAGLAPPPWTHLYAAQTGSAHVQWRYKPWSPPEAEQHLLLHWSEIGACSAQWWGFGWSPWMLHWSPPGALRLTKVSGYN